MKLESLSIEGTWYDGTWCGWRWRTSDHRSSSSSQAGWRWHDWGRHSPWSNPGWLRENSPDTTFSDPRQYGDERSEVTPSWDEVVAWWEAGLLDPAKAKPKNRLMSGAGDCRMDQMCLRQQLRRRLRRRESRSTSHREMPRLTAIPRAGALQGVIPLHQQQSGAYTAQGVEALETK